MRLHQQRPPPPQIRQQIDQHNLCLYNCRLRRLRLRPVPLDQARQRRLFVTIVVVHTHCGIDAWIRCTYLFKMAATMARTNTTPNIIPHGAVLSTFTPNCITIEFRARGPTKVYYADILPAGGTNTCVSFLSFCSIDIQ